MVPDSSVSVFKDKNAPQGVAKRAREYDKQESNNK